MLDKPNLAALSHPDHPFSLSKDAAKDFTLSSLPDLAVPFDLRNDLRPGDLGALVSLHGSIYARECGFDSTFEAYVARLMGDFVNMRTDRDQIWIAEWNGCLAGSIAILSHSKKDAQLCWYLVDPPARSMGLGRKLLREAVAFCHRYEYEYVFVSNFNMLNTASYLFQSVGFQKAGKRQSKRWGVTVVEEVYALYPFGQRPSPPGELSNS